MSLGALSKESTVYVVDYRQGRIWKNQGMRIDYVFSSETLMPSIEDVYVVEEIRKRRNRSLQIMLPSYAL